MTLSEVSAKLPQVLFIFNMSVDVDVHPMGLEFGMVHKSLVHLTALNTQNNRKATATAESQSLAWDMLLMWLKDEGLL